MALRFWSRSRIAGVLLDMLLASASHAAVIKAPDSTNVLVTYKEVRMQYCQLWWAPYIPTYTVSLMGTISCNCAPKTPSH